MPSIKLLLAPVRRILRFPLVQLAITVAAIMWLQAADDNSALGEIYAAFDRLVDFSVQRCAAILVIKSFNKAWLTTGFWIAYVYLAGLLILYLAKIAVMALVELAARYNIFYLRNVIAHERGIEAYRAWLPLERIRPAHIAQAEWEERFAWPADNKPPYPSWQRRLARMLLLYIIVLVIAAVLLQEFTPFPIITWLANAVKRLASGT